MKALAKPLLLYAVGLLALGLASAASVRAFNVTASETAAPVNALLGNLLFVYFCFAAVSTAGLFLLLRHWPNMAARETKLQSGEPSLPTAFHHEPAGQIATLIRTITVQRNALLTETAERAAAEKALEICEEKLRQAQKMEAVGRLASGIAHDFNNLLTAILGYAGLIQMETDKGSPSQLHALEIVKAGEHAGCLTHQLLSFSRQHGLEPRTLNLNDLILGMQGMIRRLIGEVVELRIHPSEDFLWLRADRTQVQQVILNLAVNARDAMRQGGQLTIASSRCQVPELNSLGLAAGDYVQLIFEDTGEGIPAETLEHIFEPFFTTKAPGQGTGLGLATVCGIVQGSGGVIDVESTVGVGTRFAIYLPATESDAPVELREPVAAAPVSLKARPERVLVVEDDEIVCQLVCRVLEDRGYEVLAAMDGEEALEFGEDRLSGMDLLIADVVMPRLGGVELSRRLRERHPDLPVVLMSGYSETDLRKFSELDENSNILKKPFGPEVLTRRVREALDLQLAGRPD